MTYTRSKDGSTYHLASCRYANPKVPWLWAGNDRPETIWVRLASNGLFGPRWNKPCWYCLPAYHISWGLELRDSEWR